MPWSLVLSSMPPTITRKADVAHDMLEALPPRAVNIIKGGGWRGGDLVKIDSEISRPSFRDFMSNKMFFFIVNLVCMFFNLNLFICRIFAESSYSPDRKLRLIMYGSNRSASISRNPYQADCFLRILSCESKNPFSNTDVNLWRVFAQTLNKLKGFSFCLPS